MFSSLKKKFKKKKKHKEDKKKLVSKSSGKRSSKSKKSRTPEKLEVTDENGRIRRRSREEIVEIYQKKQVELRRIQALTENIRNILKQLAESLQDVEVPGCWCLDQDEANDLADAIEKCIEDYDETVFNTSFDVRDDENTYLLKASTLTEKLTKYTVAKQHIEAHLQYFEDTTLERLWEKVCAFNDNIERAQNEMNRLRDKIDQLKDSYFELKYSFVLCRFNKYKKLIEHVTSDLDG